VLETRTALVTGGTDGIGKAAALALARAGHRVLIVGRDQTKGGRAAREIRASAASEHVEFLAADLSLVAGAEQLAAEVAERCNRLHVLFHSAGGVSFRRRLTRDGIESNLALNYVTRFALTLRLLPLLVAAGRPGRAARVLTAGGAVRTGRMHWDDVSLAANFNIVRSIMQVQHANDVWVIELGRRLTAKGEPVTSACVKFGAIQTGTRRTFPLWARWLLSVVVDPFVGRSAEEAGDAAAKVALDPALEGVSGALFELVTKLRRVEPDARVLDLEEGRRLWELSERLARLDAPERVAV
jgi:NAD(P)-dependent dehydrogenase (short-subunit alcohol dehydrogenase family)